MIKLSVMMISAAGKEMPIEIWLNPRHIISLNQDGKRTRIVTTASDRDAVRVIETPEEVVALINAELHRWL